VALGAYPRYAGPYCQADFPPENIHIAFDNHTVDLNWLTPARENSGLIDD
jgi:hypothetical protein